MDYTLAKQLKDAGFPQGHYQKVFDQVREYPEQANMYAEAYMVKSLDEIVYYPTLSELIEACGDGFDSLIREQDTFCALYDEYGNDERKGEGKTPEEAVSMLWLAINKK